MEWREEKVTKLYRAVAYVSMFIIILTTSYGIIATIFSGVEVVGETFVNVEFPPIHIFPFFYMKPITWLFSSILLFAFSGLELSKTRVGLLSPFTISLIKIAVFAVTSLSLYEVLFNFTLWSGLIATDSLLGKLNPDLIINPFPNPEIPWNIVFATKLYLAATIVGIYLFYFISKYARKEHA